MPGGRATIDSTDPRGYTMAVTGTGELARDEIRYDPADPATVEPGDSWTQACSMGDGDGTHQE